MVWKFDTEAEAVGMAREIEGQADILSIQVVESLGKFYVETDNDIGWVRDSERVIWNNIRG